MGLSPTAGCVTHGGTAFGSESRGHEYVDEMGIRRAHLTLLVALFAVIGACTSEGPGSVIGKIQGNETNASWNPGPLPAGQLGPGYRLDPSPAIPPWLADAPTAQAIVDASGQPLYFLDPERGTLYFRSTGEPCTELLRGLREDLSAGDTHPYPPPIESENGSWWSFQCRAGESPPLGQL